MQQYVVSKLMPQPPGVCAAIACLPCSNVCTYSTARACRSWTLCQGGTKNMSVQGFVRPQLISQL